MPLTAGILAAMRYICFCDPKRLFSFTLGGFWLPRWHHESYLTTQLERGFSALDFINRYLFREKTMSELYEKSLAKLELDKVLEMLGGCAGSEEAKTACRGLRPVSDLET